jgi:hypothetical protein
MPVFFLIYYYLMSSIPEVFNNVELYWLMQSILFMSISIYIFNKSKKNILNLFFCMGLGILFIQQILDNLLLLLGYVINDSVSEVLLSVIILVSYVLIFRSRHRWEKLKSVKYDSNKIQAIYSRPSSLITLLGATTSLSPKCSVRYSYNGKTIRFKRGNKTPILCNTFIDKDDIIEDTGLTVDYFDRRWEEIKNNKYNILTFNCRSLFEK